MKQLVFIIITLFVCSPALRAQDKIHTVDGQTIDCKIIDAERIEGKVLYQTEVDGEPYQQFILSEAVKSLEQGDKKLVRNAWNRFEPLNIKYSVKQPEHKNMYGISGGVLSSFYAVAASYTRYFNNSHGLMTELSYQNAKQDIPNCWGVGLVPHYEYRTFLQRMGSFLYLQLGLGVNYYTTLSEVEPWINPIHTYNSLAIATGFRIGFDVRLCRGLYLDISGRVHWEPTAFDLSDSFQGVTVHPVKGFGFMLGLRFGREQ